MQLENPKPQVFQTGNFEFTQQYIKRKQQEYDLDVEDPIDEYEIFDLIKTIKDPEHSFTLEQLNIVNPSDIQIKGNRVMVYFTPTIPHCSMAQTIGLTLKIKLMRSLPKNYKVYVEIKQNMHIKEVELNKLFQDKERVLAAIENQQLLKIINFGIQGLR
ncbi:unnamed protein product (macronuclear) [Paramecium tetraurelia]|uniref:MIP18 family-like domain-containing protein n=1 Tax=Paramecium tetraurelia TaxID=5888 RepID=A0DP48_PARTE|nr:uncharacterized protein GSPATT00018996001 [Paramecium tetraurelia]CAK84815.1 unnamed protein product [Paramecium tetraurelia]|eukprot:XP_001452212.1 hypothetical protein (macronuclear) [Paramecium tetraurelia strain d4-2]